MILLWAIFFSALPLWPATVSGRVELRDSRDPAVRYTEIDLPAKKS